MEKFTLTAVAFLLALALAPAAQARLLWSYSISEERCGPGSECLRRIGSVTNDSSDGPVKVGGTPKSNPYNPDSCPPSPKRKGPGTAAYSSLGWDPDNPANAEKYNVKKLKPIKGWPKEWHLEIDDNLRAWRDSVLVRGKKAGAKTVEADNSDIPGYDLGRIAAQLNHECDLHKAFGEPCPLKNNPEILGLLNHRPEYWILETGDGNGGTSLIQKAKSSGLPPDSIFIVHYGSPTTEVCDMLPGSHVVFSKSIDLSVANLSACPGTSPGGSAPPPMPSSTAERSCQPPDKRTDDRYSGSSSPPAGIPPPIPGYSPASSSPLPSSASSERAAYPIRRPPLTTPTTSPPSSPRAARETRVPAHISPRNDSLITGRELGDESADDKPQSPSRGRSEWSEATQQGTITATFARAPAGHSGLSDGQAVGTGISSPQAVGMRASSIPPNGTASSPSNPKGTSIGEGSDHVLSEFSGKKLSDPNMAVSFEDLDSAKRMIESDFGVMNAGTKGYDENTQPETLFTRIHGRIEQAQRGGKVSSRP